MPVGANLSLNADFSTNSIGFAAPVIDGLEYWNYFGESAAKTGRNLVVGKSAAAVLGAPVVSPNFVTFQSNAVAVQTGLLDRGEVTLLAVARPTTPSQTQFKYMLSSYNGSAAAQGSGLYFDNTAASKPGVLAARNNGTSDVTATAALTTDSSAFAFYAGRIGAAYNRIDSKTAGIMAAGAIANPRSVPNGILYRVGAAPSVAGGGQTDMAFAAIYSRCLTDAEIDAIYQRVKAYLSSKSSPIAI
ncbi:hypothetical protein ACSD7O_19535 [Methylorubrum extorquens]|uniref:hypothetical protein n=1 Tax=Methylorubrum extorquens TaxID=408 RepID=UPI003F623C56